MTFLPAHEDDQRTRPIIGCAIQIHKELGPGLLEAPYQAALCIALLAEKVGLIITFNRPRLLDGVKRVCR